MLKRLLLALKESHKLMGAKRWSFDLTAITLYTLVTSVVWTKREGNPSEDRLVSPMMYPTGRIIGGEPRHSRPENRLEIGRQVL